MRSLCSLAAILAGALTATAAPPAIPAPVQIGEWPGVSRGSASAVAVSGRFAYVAIGGGGLAIFDISNPASPVRVVGFDTSGSANHVRVVGNLAYVGEGDGRAGLQIIDVSNPASPVGRGRLALATGSFAWHVEVVGNLAYVGNGSAGPSVPREDASDRAQPGELEPCSDRPPAGQDEEPGAME